MKGKSILHILYEYELNIYLTVDSVVKLSQKMNKIAHISVRDIHTIDYVQNNIFSQNFQNQRRIEFQPFGTEF